MAMTATMAHISTKAQVTLPAAMRQIADIHDGDAVLFVAHGNELVLRKYTEEDNSWYKYAETGFAEWDNEADEVYNTL
ncbi:MAG: AbrB/MazE/SpoVT family DNA-binding domain-containing protein [Turneriella sp.]